MLHGCVCVYVLLPAEKESEERETEVGNDGSQKCGETQETEALCLKADYKSWSLKSSSNYFNEKLPSLLIVLEDRLHSCGKIHLL